MHLQTGSALSASAESRVGYADHVIGATITGWAMDMLALARPVVLRATIDGAPAGEARCALPRDDIRAAGIPCDTGGFRYAIPADFMDGRAHVLRLELPGGAPVLFPAPEGSLSGQHAFRIAGTDAATGCVDMLDVFHEHGILSGDFVKLFDVGDYLALNGGAALSTTAQCLGHFARLGRAALCPIAIEWRFEPEFYQEIAPAASRMAAGDAYLHWLNGGLQDGISPNQSRFLKNLGLNQRGGMPSGFDTKLYRALNPDIAATCPTRWDALRHAIEHGIADGRDGCPPPERAADLYLAAADRLAISDRLDAAKRIYETVLASAPNNAAGLQHYGDCLLRMDDPYAAEQVYLRVVSLGAGNVWTDLNLAKCRTRTGRKAAAARGLTELRARMPGDPGVAAEARAAAAACFDELRAQAGQLAGHGFVAEGRARMAQAADILVQPVRELLPGVAAPRGAIRAVAIVADLSLPQCRFYRVEQKAEQLEAAGFTARVFDQAHDLAGFAAALPFVDGVIFYRLAATPAIIGAIEAARAAGVATIYETDDLIFDPAHFPDSFASYGGLVSPEEYGDLATGTELFRAAMSLCDYALASTPSLARMMQPHVRAGRAFVHRNALGAAHLRHAPRLRVARAGGPVRIFYGTGTRAGNADFERLAAPALDRLMQAHEDVELVVMGHLALPSCLNRHAARIRMLEPVWDLDSYWSVLAGMDVSIAVLQDGVLSDCKSEIKWLEAAMLGIPSVMSPTATYREVIEDGVTGLLAGTSETWFAALDRLVRDPALRGSIGRAAHEQAHAAYGLEQSAANLRSMFAALAAPARSRRRRVLIVNVFFPPQDIGGATRVVADNVRDLLDEHGDSLEIEVFTTTEGGAVPHDLRSYVWNGIRVTAATASNGPRPDWEPDDPMMGELFGRVLERFQPDLVHFHCIQRLTGAVCRATRARGIPYLVTVHDGWWISDSQFLLGEGQLLDIYDHANPARQLEIGGADSFRRMTALAGHLAAARSVLAVSEPFAAIYRTCGFANVEVVANGVPDLALAPRAPSPDGRVRLAHIGGAAAHKGYNLLKAVLATCSFQNLSLTVIDHALLPGVESSDVWGTVPVRFRPRMAQAGIGALYAEIDVLVAPSLWPESYGLVAREALRAGCWVIASDRGAMGGDVRPDNGFVVDVGTTEGLRAVLARIDADPEGYRQACAPPPAMRSSRDQARDLARLYLDPQPRRGGGARRRAAPARTRRHGEPE